MEEYDGSRTSTGAADSPLTSAAGIFSVRTQDSNDPLGSITSDDAAAVETAAVTNNSTDSAEANWGAGLWGKSQM